MISSVLKQQDVEYSLKCSTTAECSETHERGANARRTGRPRTALPLFVSVIIVAFDFCFS